MPFARTILLLTLSVLVAGCAATAEQQAKLDSDRCAARGFKPDTPEHDRCMSQVAGARDARLQARHRELVERPPTTYGR